jgi:diguanylate cyclase (GGDEF)-like protein
MATSSEPAAKPSVLVVDDDAPTRLLITRWIEKAGFEVVQAEDGLGALRQLESEPARFAVIVLDVMMPGLDGFEVLSRMKENPLIASVPVVLLTAHANDEHDVVRGIESGAVYHLEKPFSGPVLVGRIRSLWERRQKDLELAEQLADAKALAMTDQLTALSNRRAFDEQLERETSFTARHKQPLALLLIDLDHFKSINDLFGHPAGDTVLSYFADQLRATLRRSDHAYRIGGEEFAVLLRDTDFQRALAAAERLRQALAGAPVELDGDHRVVTFSAGVAAADGSNAFATARLLERADDALYRAKRGGRDRTEREPE